MKVLVTGGSSLLGLYLLRSIPAGVKAEFTWYSACQPWTAHRMDVTDLAQVRYVFQKVKPEAVVHMAGMGNVDECERNYREAHAVNVDGTRNVLAVAEDYGATVLMTSTNAVYEGTDPPYREGDELKPINAYGKIRKNAERFVAGYGHKWQIARMFLLYGWEPVGARGNWASTAYRKLRKGERLRMVWDVQYMPTWAADAARALWTLLLDGDEGVYNVAGEHICSLYAFTLVLADVFGLDKNLVESVSILELDGLAPRPTNTAYDLSKAQALGVRCRGFGDGLKAMKEELCLNG